MGSIIEFLFFILDSLLGLLWFAIIASAILSWLFAFNVINYHNDFVRNVARFLDAVTTPVLRPFQRLIPNLGGVDISPIFALLVIGGIRGYLLAPAKASLHSLLG